MLNAYYLAGRRGIYMQWNSNSTLSGLLFFDKILLKIGLYGAEIWDHNPTQTNRIDKKQARILKSCLCMHPKTHTNWILWETNTLPSAIAIDKAKAKAWRSWLVKQRQGIEIPEYVRNITSKAMTRLGRRLPKWLKTELDDYPNKENWGIMVNKWAKQKATKTFQEWWDVQTNTSNQDKGTNKIELKNNWGNTQKYIMKTKTWLGAKLTIFLKARANTLGLKCDDSIRNQGNIEKQFLMCRSCLEGKKRNPETCTLTMSWT